MKKYPVHLLHFLECSRCRSQYRNMGSTLPLHPPPLQVLGCPSLPSPPSFSWGTKLSSYTASPPSFSWGTNLSSYTASPPSFSWGTKLSSYTASPSSSSRGTVVFLPTLSLEDWQKRVPPTPTIWNPFTLNSLFLQFNHYSCKSIRKICRTNI